MMLMGEISWQGLRSGLAEGGLRGELNIRHRRTPVGHCVSAGGSFALLISARARPRIATYRDQEARRALTGPPSESNLGGPCSLLLRFLAPRRRWGWPRDRECIRADAPLHLRPCHRRGDREALPSARGIGADRRRAASVAQIIDIDTLVAFCRRGRGRVTSGSCRFQALRHPVAIQARGVVTDVAADRDP